VAGREGHRLREDQGGDQGGPDQGAPPNTEARQEPGAPRQPARQGPLRRRAQVQGGPRRQLQGRGPRVVPHALHQRQEQEARLLLGGGGGPGALLRRRVQGHQAQEVEEKEGHSQHQGPQAKGTGTGTTTSPSGVRRPQGRQRRQRAGRTFQGGIPEEGLHAAAGLGRDTEGGGASGSGVGRRRGARQRAGRRRFSGGVRHGRGHPGDGHGDHRGLPQGSLGNRRKPAGGLPELRQANHLPGPQGHLRGRGQARGEHHLPGDRRPGGGPTTTTGPGSPTTAATTPGTTSGSTGTTASGNWGSRCSKGRYVNVLHPEDHAGEDRQGQGAQGGQGG
jgi:hypothetical protein